MNDIIVGIGEILWDVFPNRKVLGGAPANFAYHVSQLGFNGYAISAIGDDLLGKEILSALEEKGLNYLLETTDYPTGTVQVTLDGAGVPSYEIMENVAWDNIPFTVRTENLAKMTRAVCFGSLAQRSPVSRGTILKYLDAMPGDSLKIFDINFRQNFYTMEVVEFSLRQSNVLKINDEEMNALRVMLGLPADDSQAAMQLISKYGLRILIMTCGTAGSYVFTPDRTSFQPTPKVHVADTVGAGDSFAAAFTAAYLHGMDISAAHQLAAEISAYVCLQHGAMPRLADSYLELFRGKR